MIHQILMLSASLEINLLCVSKKMRIALKQKTMKQKNNLNTPRFRTEINKTDSLGAHVWLMAL